MYRFDHFGIQPGDDRFWRQRRRHQSKPAHRLKARIPGFGDGGDIGRHGHTIFSRHRKELDLAAFGMARNGGHAAEHDADVAAQQINDSLSAPLVYDVVELDACGVLQQLRAQMAYGAYAAGRIIELARFSLGQRHELLYRGGAHRRVNRKHIGGGRQLRDRRKVLNRIVADVSRNRGICRQRGYVDKADGMAIGTGLRHDLCADGAVAAGAIVQHDLLAKLLRQLRGNEARNGVRAAARRERHHKSDGSRRIRFDATLPALGEDRADGPERNQAYKRYVFTRAKCHLKSSRVRRRSATAASMCK